MSAAHEDFVVASVLLEPRLLESVERIVSHEHLSREALDILAAVRKVRRGNDLDGVELLDALGGGEKWMRRIDDLMTAVPHGTNATFHARKLRHYVEGEKIQAAAERLRGEDTDQNRQALARLIEHAGAADNGIPEPSSVFHSFESMMADPPAKPPAILGDGLLIPGGFMLLVGKPGVGKSWLSLGVSCDVAEGGTPLGYFPSEGADVLLAFPDVASYRLVRCCRLLMRLIQRKHQLLQQLFLIPV